MTKWNLQSEKPIQEHFTRPCWVQHVQREKEFISYVAPRHEGLGMGDYLHCYLMRNFFTYNAVEFIDPRCFAEASLPVDEIVAWQYAELPPQPEPYVTAPPPPKMRAEWIDGAVRVPSGFERDSGFLIRQKDAWYHKAAEWVPWAKEFVYIDKMDPAFQCKIYKPETVEWLEITEEQS